MEAAPLINTTGSWLVFGATAAIGRALRAAHRDDDPPLLAASRSPPADAGPGLRWWQGALPALGEPPVAVAAIASLGPLDLFADWFAARAVRVPRVVALGSTSVHSKPGSPDPAERALAARLREAEDRLASAVAARGGHLLLLRPTLVYGGGDQALDRLAALARRWRWLPLPRGATGLRQPVHVQDVAAAVLAGLRAAAPLSARLDLPGGERLPAREMFARTLAVHAPGARRLPVPAPAFTLALRLAAALGRGPGPGFAARLGQDLCYDGGEAARLLGFRPRPFQP